MAPSAIYLLVLMAFPLLWSVYISMTDKRTGVAANFTGFQNYLRLAEDHIFWKTVGNTFTYTLVCVVLKVFLGIILALLLNSMVLKFKNIFRSLTFLPWALPTLVSVYTWKWIFSDIGGALNRILQVLHIIETPIGWFATPKHAMFSVIMINIWRGIPFIGISVLAGLQTINRNMYEAADIDGANKFKQFCYITLPCIKNVVLLGAVITTIWTLNDFEIIWLLTRGGPDNGTQVFSTLAYTYGFLNRDLGLSVAISVVSLPLSIFLVGIAAKQFMKENVE